MNPRVETPALRAGVARAALPVACGWPMMGYGARRGGAEGQHDPLFARAIYLENGGRVLVVECDVCLMSVSQAHAVRRRIADRSGLEVEEVLVGCTHTHSGPDTGIAAVLAGADPPAHAAGLLDAAVEAGVEAVVRARPARLGVGRTVADIGRNRRRADAPVDASVVVVRVDDPRGEPLAVLYVHGCHPTALGHDNLRYSADWPGQASRAIEEALPGVLAIFAPGAHADVDPRTRGLLDLAVADQSVGVGFDEMAALGREVGRAVVECASAIDTRRDARIASACARIAIPVHASDGPDPDRALRIERRRASALDALGLPGDATPRTAELFGLEASLRDLPPEEARARIARVRLYVRDRTAPRIAGGLRPRVEVQLLRIGPLRVLALPLECCADVALEWAERLGGAEPTAVVSIANGWLRYLPHERHFAEPLAEQGYEVLQSTLVPEASRRLLDAAESLARRTEHGGTAA